MHRDCLTIRDHDREVSNVPPVISKEEDPEAAAARSSNDTIDDTHDSEEPAKITIDTGTRSHLSEAGLALTIVLYVEDPGRQWSFVGD